MSLSLQANWQDLSLYLWARPWPGAQPPDAPALRAAVGDVSSDALLASAVADGSLMVWLPADDDDRAPRQGDSIGGGNHHATATAVAPGFKTLRVPALVLGPAEAIDFLTSLPVELPGFCAPSIAYWATLARFVCRLVAARQFMPRLETGDDGTLSACWSPLVSVASQLAGGETFAS